LDINPELRGFVDADGRFKAWPAKQSKQIIMVDMLAELFEPGRNYTSQDVNEILNTRHTFHDPAILRRSMIDRKILERSPDGKTYWKPAPPEEAPKAEG